jgi:FAD/FMN-containing dehydrogenase
VATARRDTGSPLKALRSLLTGQVVLPADAAYDPARQLWNGKVDKRPAALVRPADAQDVVHTVRWARARGFALSVRAGGHDFAGRALCDGGLVIDLSPLRAVSIDPVARTAVVQGGATAGDLIDAAQKHGLATTTGTVSSVGMAGLTLGGGYGPLAGKYGLVADNLLSAQVVTADGHLVTASAREHPDLFWALRGGGGNFGVVVTLEYRLHPVTAVLSGLMLYGLDQAGEVLRSYGELIKTVPDELTIQPGFIQLPDRPPVLFLSPTYCGPLDDGERALAPLRALGQPLVDQVEPVTYDVLITTLNALFPGGRHYFIQTQSLAGLRAETIDALVALAQPLSSPSSAVSIHHFHGAASRVAASATAFAPRRDHLMVEIVAAWEPRSPQEDQRHVRWAQEGARSLAPYALPGGYVNLLDEGEQGRIPLAYGPNYGRLVEVKRTYDPDDVFHSTIGHVTPSTSS